LIKPSAGHYEIEHTADWELEVWAPDLPGLLEQAAIGLYALSGTILQNQPRMTRSFTIHAHDREEMLVSFLSELLYIEEQEGLGFDQFQLAVKDETLFAELSGSTIASINKEIKAVTYHQLEVKENPQGFETRIVFDV
jgi:SHS2 domain-containing protein